MLCAGQGGMLLRTTGSLDINEEYAMLRNPRDRAVDCRILSHVLGAYLAKARPGTHLSVNPPEKRVLDSFNHGRMRPQLLSFLPSLSLHLVACVRW
jgi:hypothetical protein